MDIDTLLSLGFQASLFLIVLAAGMAAQHGEATALLRKPALLIRSVIAMLLLAPLLAVGLASTLPLQPAVKIALVALAVSPVPPFLPKKTFVVDGDRSYAVSLLATSALLSTITVPVTLSFLSDVVGLPLLLPAATLAKQLLLGVLIPLAAGLLMARIAPAFCATWAADVSGAAALVFSVTIVPRLVLTLPAFRELSGDGTLVVMAAYAIGTLLAGHVLGGPVRENRHTLALSAATRHPAIALSLAQANFADQRLAVPAVLLLVVVTGAMSAPYLALIRRRHPRPAEADARVIVSSSTTTTLTP
jgi:BASS family bile acid:Na+ symporter